MSDLEQRVKLLEAKVKILEETLETLKNMGVSEQMEGYIKQKNKTLKMVSLLNSVSDEPSFDFGQQEEAIAHLRTVKNTVDEQIRSAVRNAGTFSDDFHNDPNYFNYEVETGMTTDNLYKRQEKNPALNAIVGKGLRITSYNGFETKRVIIPNEINGQPVISIGEKAFVNAPITQIVLPTSLKAILPAAFEGCVNLTHLDLPEGIKYLGDNCFRNSGVVEVVIPDSVTTMGHSICENCKNLENVVIGNHVTKIEYCAFQNCSKLKKLSIPIGIKDISFGAFDGTDIRVMVFPENVERVDSRAFKYMSRFSRSNSTICAFLGRDTAISIGSGSRGFEGVSEIYCLPGSKVQLFARENRIQIKPLSEFRME